MYLCKTFQYAFFLSAICSIKIPEQILTASKRLKKNFAYLQRNVIKIKKNRKNKA